MPEKAFAATDVFGYTVECTEHRWAHVTAGHDELEGRIDDVKRVIETPQVVYASKSYGDRYVAIGSNAGNGKKYIKAVVQVSQTENIGTVKTAYTAMEIGGENIDASQQLYP